MTMRLKITNLGPSDHLAVVTRGTEQPPLATLRDGESTEVYCWHGADLRVEERPVASEKVQ